MGKDGLTARAGSILQERATPVQDLDADPAKPIVPSAAPFKDRFTTSEAEEPSVKFLSSKISIASNQEHDLPAESTWSEFEARILPSPAAHALLYAEDTARVLSAYIRKFFSNVDQRNDPGWQLHYLIQGDKWDVKHLKKWQEVEPVSKPIASFFRALKTLREVDATHTPKVFAKEWSPLQGNGLDGLGSIAAVIDISHDAPVYFSDGLEAGGIAYYKWPTVSKFPPTAEKIKAFIELVDSVNRDIHSGSRAAKPGVHRLIAVHCHYGFNRTGSFLVGYMVERLGYNVKDAIAEFARMRPDGIHHRHFIDELYAQYRTHDD